ncbi:hypothetical protein RhiirC2_708278 [Rhizophagus irregularis]|uniref:RNase H type-1 domain-containing protein n=1 Tax=Rhizophagus irregularis TaxID=588596 RepID=A0A2N1N907_9GLOM|nr:hypothetical protein RhiirC2_711948 [Rhizophagus irregularis]PKK75234.1 hypothetical protein RhiirC2_708278 [Rhizophagus irregularis]
MKPEGVRFLGVRFANKANFQSHNIMIENVVKQMVNIMRWKKLTLKECITFWNSVVIPMVEYQMQCTVVNETLAEKLDSKIRNLIKHKGELAVHTSNWILHDKDFMGCKSIVDLQKEVLIKNLLYSLNQDGLLGKIMRIKVASIKQHIWFNGCIFSEVKHILNSEKQIWLLEGIKLLANDNFKLCDHGRTHDHVTSGGHTLIDEMIDKKNFSSSVQSLKSVNIMYVTQLIDENNRLKTWRQITREAGRSSKGRIPLWFNEIEKKMMKNDQREVYSGYELIREVYDRYNNDIVYENYWNKLESEFAERDLEELLEIDNRFNVMKMGFEECGGILELQKMFLKLGEVKQENINLYTDGSKKNRNNGIGWVIMYIDNIIGKGNFKIEGKYEVWKLELIAIIMGLLVIKKRAKVNVYTDSQVVLVDLWHKLIIDNRMWSTRRIWNVKSVGLWRWLKFLIKKFEWDLVFYKVKSHSGNLGNDWADNLSKSALMAKEDKNLIIIKLNQKIDWEYNLYWKKELIKDAPREFYKLYNQWRYKAELLSLDMCKYYRLNNSMEKVDWHRSIKIIMKAFNDENTDKNNFDNAYNVKNFLEILPVATLLNKRNPELYESGRCIRCNYTTEHGHIFGYVIKQRHQYFK